MMLHSNAGYRQHALILSMYGFRNNGQSLPNLCQGAVQSHPSKGPASSYTREGDLPPRVDS